MIINNKRLEKYQILVIMAVMHLMKPKIAINKKITKSTEILRIINNDLKNKITQLTHILGIMNNNFKPKLTQKSTMLKIYYKFYLVFSMTARFILLRKTSYQD